MRSIVTLSTTNDTTCGSFLVTLATIGVTPAGTSSIRTRAPGGDDAIGISCVVPWAMVAQPAIVAANASDDAKNAIERMEGGTLIGGTGNVAVANTRRQRTGLHRPGTTSVSRPSQAPSTTTRRYGSGLLDTMVRSTFIA